MKSVKSVLELAALATAAVPGLRITELRSPQSVSDEQLVTGIVDTDGNNWMVVASTIADPQDVDRQFHLLRVLGEYHKNKLFPFPVAQLEGIVAIDENTYVRVLNYCGGQPCEENDFNVDGLLSASLGRALAAIHNLPMDILPGGSVEDPAVTVAGLRNQLRKLLNSGGRGVPTRLKQRWLTAIEKDVLWNITPTPIQAELDPTSIFAEDGAIITISGLEKLHPGDPAEDLAWLLPLACPEFIVRFQESYASLRKEVDLHLLTRAQFYSEIALVRWLAHGLKTRDQEIIDQANTMLSELDDDLGGEMLVESSRPVAEIHFTAEEEPLSRLATESSLAEHSEEHLEDMPPREDAEWTPDSGVVPFDDQLRQDDISTTVFVSPTPDVIEISQTVTAAITKGTLFEADLEFSAELPASQQSYATVSDQDSEETDLEELILETEDLSHLLDEILLKDGYVSQESNEDDDLSQQSTL